eukprot:SAG31_NODE_4334_length_3344_cov_4.039753_1_plen_116_part_10
MARGVLHDFTLWDRHVVRRLTCCGESWLHLAIPDKPIVVVVIVSAEPVFRLGSQPLRCNVLGHPAIRQRVAVGFEHRSLVQLHALLDVVGRRSCVWAHERARGVASVGIDARPMTS